VASGGKSPSSCPLHCPTQECELAAAGRSTQQIDDRNQEGEWDLSAGAKKRYGDDLKVCTAKIVVTAANKTMTAK